jgi:20S proteasome alpha/beta subunit
LKVSRQGWLKFCHPAQTGSHADVQYSVLFSRYPIINHEEYVKVFLECIKNAIENVMNRGEIVFGEEATLADT